MAPLGDFSLFQSMTHSFPSGPALQHYMEEAIVQEYVAPK